ncbi:MAG: hypothetical protein ACLFUP_08405 [Desulfobacteraceae bacterium]
MESCRHRKLVLVDPEPAKLRCRRCNLTIRREDLDGDYCPECLEERGERHSDWEELEPGPVKPRYRCEDCGALIEAEAEDETQ